jgi:hypothetical protein
MRVLVSLLAIMAAAIMQVSMTFLIYSVSSFLSLAIMTLLDGTVMTFLGHCGFSTSQDRTILGLSASPPILGLSDV